MVLKTDASVVSGNTTSDTNSDVSDNSQQANEHEMTDLSQENEDDDSVINKIETNCFIYKTFVHVFDQCSQDSETILTILNDILCRMKETDQHIKSAFIRSDNTGCYRSTNTLAAAKQISKRTGIVFKQIDFCDPQGGKGPCDRYATVIKSHIRRYLNENHNVTSASEFVAACHSHKGVNGVLALNCQITNNTRKKETKCKIKQITDYFNFEYLRNGL